MNRLFRYILTAAALACSVFAAGQAPDPGFSDKRAGAESLSWGKALSMKEQEDINKTDLIYQRLEWEVDPAVKFISGKITSYFVSRRPGVTQISFSLKDNMVVDSVLQRGVKLNFTHKGDMVSINLASTLEMSTLDSLSLFYRGRPADTGFGSFMTSTHNAIPVMWTLSEPYGAMEWWPCRQSLSDKIDSVDIIVTTPEFYRTASNGLVVEEKVTGGNRTMFWKHRYPIATYLVAIAVTNYADYTDTLFLEDGRYLPVLNFVYPERLALARSQTPQTLSLISLFSRLFGEYPFMKEKYGHAQFGFGGAMEHQTMTFINNFDFELMAHELAHSWFGNSITLASWHDIWLNEGFATFATGLSYERLFDGKYWKQWLKNNLENIVSLPGGSVYVADTTSVSRVFNGRLSYAKGGYLLQMLRWILGDEQFFSALRNYYADTRLKYGFATQQQWVNHLEAASGRKLTEFFNDWYYGEGFPVYSASYARESPGTLRIRLSQKSSHASVDFFEMPVPVRVYSAERKDSLDFRLDHSANGQVFDLSVPFDVTELVIDPDLWLIRKIDRVMKIRQVKENPDISVIPNPFSCGFRLTVPLDEEVESLQIFDLAGRLVFRHSGHQDYFSPGLKSGTYLLKIFTSTRVYETRLVSIREKCL